MQLQNRTERAFLALWVVLKSGFAIFLIFKSLDSMQKFITNSFQIRKYKISANFFSKNVTYLLVLILFGIS
jgi:hypothetical protein